MGVWEECCGSEGEGIPTAASRIMRHHLGDGPQTAQSVLLMETSDPTHLGVLCGEVRGGVAGGLPPPSRVGGRPPGLTFPGFVLGDRNAENRWWLAVNQRQRMVNRRALVCNRKQLRTGRCTAGVSKAGRYFGGLLGQAEAFPAVPTHARTHTHTHTHFGDKQSTEKAGLDVLDLVRCKAEQTHTHTHTHTQRKHKTQRSPVNRKYQPATRPLFCQTPPPSPAARTPECDRAISFRGHSFRLRLDPSPAVPPCPPSPRRWYTRAQWLLTPLLRRFCRHPNFSLQCHTASPSHVSPPQTAFAG